MIAGDIPDGALSRVFDVYNRDDNSLDAHVSLRVTDAANEYKKRVTLTNTGTEPVTVRLTIIANTSTREKFTRTSRILLAADDSYTTTYNKIACATSRDTGREFVVAHGWDRDETHLDCSTLSQ